jgi:hypothetical protein
VNRSSILRDQTGYYDTQGKYVTSTHGGFYTGKDGEWCEGTVAGGFYTPTGEWICGSLSDQTKVAGIEWFQLKISAMPPTYTR